jgi:murein DD-endopeptidase MepM/ murein hydrolase activator NlpD
VRQALGVNNLNEAVGMQLAAGQQMGLVGETDSVSSGAHLDYKIKVNGVFSDPQQFLQAVANGGGTLRTINISNGAIGSTQVGAVR